jgi:tRNA1Val (adenine37-N6)-methyltransferase
MALNWDDEALSRDAFLGGALHIWQPRKGYRAGVDPVLLAAAVTAVAGQSVLELGCGVGVASLCLGSRVPGLRLYGVEIQGDYAELARRNSAENGIALAVTEADLRSLPDDLRMQSFDHVMMNPPYFERLNGTESDDAGRDMALGGDTPLADWLAVAARRLGPKGVLTLIQRVDRLPEVLAGLQDRLGSIIVLPLVARTGAAPDLFILQARKSGRAQFRFAPQLVLHEGIEHTRDGENYSTPVTAILRDGLALRGFP